MEIMEIDSLYIRCSTWNYKIVLTNGGRTWHALRQKGTNPYKWENFNQEKLPKTVAREAVLFWKRRNTSGWFDVSK